MANVFKIPLINPFRFVNLRDYDTRDPRYNTFPIDLEVDNKNPNGQYLQKWQFNDITKLQLDSDFADITFKIYNFCDGTFYKEIAIAAVDIAIIGQTWKVFEAEIAFADWDEGVYYGIISYTTGISKFTGVLKEALTPDFIDGNFIIKRNGVTVHTANSAETFPCNFAAGEAYSIEAFCEQVSTADNPRIRLTLIKNDEVIYDSSTVAVPGASLLKTGTAQLGAVYSYRIETEDTAVVIYPIDIADDDPVVVTRENWQTSGLHIKEKHEKTLLYEYYNTQNDKGIVFDTGIKFSFRVEGLIREFAPKSLTEDYIDQKYDVYSLNDIPYGTHNNYIGSARGLPDWVIKKMNTIFTVNSVKIDGQLFNKVSGQQFEMTRPQNGPNEQGYASIQIIENFNGDQEQYKTGEIPDGDFVVIQKVIKYYDNAANIAVAGIFKTHTNLVGLAIINKGLNAFTLNIGTTNGGSEIGSYQITADVTSFILIEKIFNAAQNVYLTGLDGTDLDIDIDYKDYDAVQVTPGVTTGGFIPNVEYTYYELNAGDFDTHFNAATGQGRPDTDFENCFLLDGQNGTINDAGLFRIGWDKTIPGLLGTVIGAVNNFIALTRTYLPAVGIPFISNSVNPTEDDTPGANDAVARASNIGNKPASYTLLKGQAGLEPSIGLSAKLGDGAPLDITPESLVVARFIYKRPVI